MPAADALCSFVTATFFLGMYFLPLAVILIGGGEVGHNPTLAYCPSRDHYMTLYMGLLYISFHSSVKNIGCEIDKAILDPLYL